MPVSRGVRAAWRKEAISRGRHARAVQDAIRIGRIIRALRRRRGWTQASLSLRAGLSQATISAIERGHIGSHSVHALESVLTAVEARLLLSVTWRGGRIDRLLDERHAALVERLVRLLTVLGWTVRVEVSYSRFGERGSIDVLGWHPARRVLAVIEVKTSIESIEETLRKLDEKERLATATVKERFGWHPEHVGTILVIHEDRTARRRVASHIGLFDAALPTRSTAVRRWLREPNGAIRGRWFLSPINRRDDRPQRRGRERIRAAHPRSARSRPAA